MQMVCVCIWFYFAVLGKGKFEKCHYISGRFLKYESLCWYFDVFHEYIDFIYF